MKLLGALGLILMADVCLAETKEDHRYDVLQITREVGGPLNGDGKQLSTERKTVMKIDKKTGQAWILFEGFMSKDPATAETEYRLVWIPVEGK